MKHTILFLCIALFVGCGGDQFETLPIGITKERVVVECGEPLGISRPFLSYTNYYYPGVGFFERGHNLIFKNDTLVSILSDGKRIK